MKSVLPPCAALVLLLHLTACDEEPAAPGGPGRPAGLAVIGSDRKSASVSLVDPATGAMARDACFHSGSTAPQLVAALSQDATLPTQPQPGHELLVVDRQHGTLTWLDPTACAVKRQLSVAGGFDANPHDVAAVSATKAYVTRYNLNPGNPAEGSDLLIIDPAAAAVTGRVDLRAHADDGLLPRPDRAAVLRGLVYVTLNHLSGDYKRAGTGKLLVIDPATDAVKTVVTLPFQNCGALAPVGDEALVIGCGGNFAAAAPIAGSGAAWLNAGESAPSATVAAAPFGRPLSFSTIAALDRRRVFTVVLGEFKGAPDAVWAFDFAGGAPTKILDASAPFSLGDLLVDAGARRLYVADSDEKSPRLRSYDIAESGAVVERPATVTSAAGLPPRALAFF